MRKYYKKMELQKYISAYFLLVRYNFVKSLPSLLATREDEIYQNLARLYSPRNVGKSTVSLKGILAYRPSKDVSYFLNNTEELKYLQKQVEYKAKELMIDNKEEAWEGLRDMVVFILKCLDIPVDVSKAQPHGEGLYTFYRDNKEIEDTVLQKCQKITLGNDTPSYNRKDYEIKEELANITASYFLTALDRIDKDYSRVLFSSLIMYGKEEDEKEDLLDHINLFRKAYLKDKENSVTKALSTGLYTRLQEEKDKDIQLILNFNNKIVEEEEYNKVIKQYKYTDKLEVLVYGLTVIASDWDFEYNKTYPINIYKIVEESKKAVKKRQTEAKQVSNILSPLSPLKIVSPNFYTPKASSLSSPRSSPKASSLSSPRRVSFSPRKQICHFPRYANEERCRGINKTNGERCNNKANYGSYCHVHKR